MKRHQILVILFLIVQAMCFSQNKNIELRNVNFFQNGQFHEFKQVYISNGMFTYKKPIKIDTIVDLKEKFVVPPFAEGHTHKLDDPKDFKSELTNFTNEGTFYAFVLTNRSSYVAENRKELNLLNILEVSYANGGITYTNQHPSFAYERIISGIENWWLPENTGKIQNSRILENDAYWFFDNVEMVNEKWDAYLKTKPDVVKIYLMNVKEGEYQGKKTISEQVAKLIVKKAKKAKLRVVAHVETFDDLKIGIRAGVNIFAHMPYYNVNFQKELPQQPKFSKKEKKEIERRKIIIIPTLSFNDEFSIVRNEENNYQGTLDTISFNRALKFQKETINTLKNSGFHFAIGSDRDGLLLELNYWFENKIFSPREILKIATQDTSELIFPKKHINKVKEGYDASFLVFDKNPLLNWDVIKSISLKMKNGKIIE